MSCNTSTSPASWDLVQTCGSGQACDVKQGSCVSTPIVGGTTPTGSYYQFASFRFATGDPNNDVYLGGMDVGSYGDHIYVHREGSPYGASTQSPMGVQRMQVSAAAVVLETMPGVVIVPAWTAGAQARANPRTSDRR